MAVEVHNFQHLQRSAILGEFMQGRLGGAGQALHLKTELREVYWKYADKIHRYVAPGLT